MFEPNLERLKEFEYFLVKVNERTEWQYGLRDKYIQPEDDEALGPDVEYFGFNILQDDRMRYIIENIVTVDELSLENKIGNTVISHFYGARGIHEVVTGIKDPKKAHVDFVRIDSGDTEYLDSIKTQIDLSRKAKKKFYGTTELHTSLQTAARNFCRKKYNEPERKASLSDIIEWVASFSSDGTFEKVIKDANSLEKMFKILTTQPGIGEYYGYHCATSNSVNPSLRFNHDETFCAPGPGARDSINYIFGDKVSKKQYGNVVVWLRDNQEQFFKDVIIHPFFHNYEVNGKKVFEDDQNNLKVYGLEVGLCQFGVYCWLKKNPHLISKRKIARSDDDSTCDGATLRNLFE